MMLQVEDLNVHYGAIHALKGISFHLEKGEIVALIGGNGAGKSTTLNTISGLLRPTQGKVVFQGENVTVVPPQDIVRRGIVQVPEGRRIFPKLTVQENLEMGAFIYDDKVQIQQDLESAMTRFPRLRERRKQMAEERAQKASTKILFPTLLCIFPAVFVILLAPAVYQAMAALGGAEGGEAAAGAPDR